jgi:non-heme chloroperoxidase
VKTVDFYYSIGSRYSYLAATQIAALKSTTGCHVEGKAFATPDFRPDLASFSVPTLIIHGTDDKTVPIDASSRITASQLTTAKYNEYEGAPHGLFATHKERLTADLLTFLKQ